MNARRRAVPPVLTAPALYAWALRTQRRRVRLSWDAPTVRDAARRFRCTQQAIVDLVESDPEVPGYLGLGVAIRTGTGGIGRLERGDWIVEAY